MVLKWLERGENGENIFFEQLHQILSEIQDINNNQVENFVQLIKSTLALEFFGHEQLAGKKVFILGAANGPQSNSVHNSPVLKLIVQLAEANVDQVVIYEETAQAALQEWVREAQNKIPVIRRTNIRVVNSLPDAFENRPDLAVIGTPHKEVMALLPQTMKKRIGETPLFDGWDIYGLQTEEGGFQNRSLTDVQKSGLNYISNGRMPIGPAFGSPQFVDSAIYAGTSDFPDTSDIGDDSGHLSLAVIGTGYVGTVLAAALAKLKHRVVGIDKIKSNPVVFWKSIMKTLSYLLEEITALFIGEFFLHRCFLFA